MNIYYIVLSEISLQTELLRYKTNILQKQEQNWKLFCFFPIYYPISLQLLDNINANFSPWTQDSTTNLKAKANQYFSEYSLI